MENRDKMWELLLSSLLYRYSMLWLLGFQLFHEESVINRLKTHLLFFCLSVLTGSQVKSSYDLGERPMAVCEFSGFVAVESKILECIIFLYILENYHFFFLSFLVFSPMSTQCHMYRNIFYDLVGGDSRFLALFNLLFLLFFPARETFNSFTEEQFCEHMRRATLSEEEFTRHRQAIQELLNN